MRPPRPSQPAAPKASGQHAESAFWERQVQFPHLRKIGAHVEVVDDEIHGVVYSTRVNQDEYLQILAGASDQNFDHWPPRERFEPICSEVPSGPQVLFDPRTPRKDLQKDFTNEGADIRDG